MKNKQKPTPTEEKAQVSFYCPVVVRDELKRIAFKEDRNLGEQITKALRDWLGSQESRMIEARGH